LKHAVAKARGLYRYEGIPCKLGHTERYVSTRSCVTCTNAASKARLAVRRATSPEYRAARRDYQAAYLRTEAGKEANKRGANKFRKREPETVLFFAARRRARELGLPFDITPQDVVIPTTCPVLGIPLAVGTGSACDSSPSLDRVIPALGYVRGNVEVMSFRANSLKRDATAAELRAVAKWLETR
jgi:hypothetical protein